MCPQATAAATRALRESSMNLNPEVDGTIIKVPVPKWVSLWRTRRQTRRRPENIFAPFSTFCLSLLLFFFWYSSIFLLHSSPCSKLTGLLTFACTCIETPGVTTWGLGQSLSLSPGQIKQPDTKQSVTHSLNRSACVYKVCFFYIYTRARASQCMNAVLWLCACIIMSVCVRMEQQVLFWQRRDTRVRLLFPLQSVSARSKPTFAFPKRRRFLIGPGIGN